MAVRLTATAAAVAASLLPTTAAADDLELTLVPFGWAPWVKGELRQGPLAVPLSAGPGDLLGGAKVGAMGYAEVRGHHFVVASQLIFLDFHDPSFAPIFDADVTSRAVSVEAMSGPIIRAGRVDLIPLAGARYNDVSGLLVAGPLGVQLGRRWVEGLVGAGVEVPLSARWGIQTRATAAIAGPSRLKSYDVILTGGYRIGKRVRVIAGYRWTKESIGARNAADLGLKLRLNGPVLGLAYTAF